ncbi:delta-60 repeat domain-containing protein [bacterium]|nr:delta-60 repeat domain-containing protein [bacterium]
MKRSKVFKILVGLLIVLGMGWAIHDFFTESGDIGSMKRSVESIAVQTDGKILVGGTFATIGGYFSIIGGKTRNYIARLNPDGTPDAGFNPNVNDGIRSVVVQPDGKILIGGGFTKIAGKTRNYIARLNPDGTLDITFDPSPNVNGSIHSIAVQPDGKIFVGGYSPSIAGKKIARLNPDGTLDTTFDPNVNAHFGIGSILIQPDGKVLIGGHFPTIAGLTRDNITRLNPDGTLDTTFKVSK